MQQSARASTVAAALPAVQLAALSLDQPPRSPRKERLARKKPQSQPPCSARKLVHRRLPSSARRKPTRETVKKGAVDAHPHYDQASSVGGHVAPMIPRLPGISSHELNKLLNPRDPGSEGSSLLGKLSSGLSIDTENVFRNFIHGYASSSQSETIEREKCGPNDACIITSNVRGEMDTASGKELRRTSDEKGHLSYFAHLPSDRRRCLLQNQLALQARRAVCCGDSSDSLRANSNLASGGSSSSRRKTILSDPACADFVALRKHAKAKVRRKEACESLRFLVFGELSEQGKSQNEQCGNKKQVFQLQKVWKELDEDGSGDVDMIEFLNFFNRSSTDKLLGMRCVHYLVGKAQSEGMKDKDVGCTIVDMMKLMWLDATDEDIETMLFWFHEAQSVGERVSTPPLLSKKKQQQILSAFPNVDWAKHQCTTWENLMAASLIDESTMRDLCELHGKQVTGPITKEELLEVLCPNGYRAHSTATKMVENNGEQLVWTENEYFTGWVKADSNNP